MGLIFEEVGQPQQKEQKEQKERKQQKQQTLRQSPKEVATGLLNLWCDAYREVFNLPYYPTPDDWIAAQGFAECNPDANFTELKTLMVKCLKEFPRLPQVRYLTATYRSRFVPTFKLFVQSINDIVALDRPTIGDWIFEDDNWMRVKGGVINL